MFYAPAENLRQRLKNNHKIKIENTLVFRVHAYEIARYTFVWFPFIIRLKLGMLDDSFDW